MSSRTESSNSPSLESSVQLRTLKDCQVVDYSLDSSPKENLSFQYEEFVAFKALVPEPPPTGSPVRKNISLTRQKERRPLKAIIDEALSSSSEDGRSSLQALDIPLTHQLHLRIIDPPRSDPDYYHGDHCDISENGDAPPSLTRNPPALSTQFTSPAPTNQSNTNNNNNNNNASNKLNDTVSVNFTTQSQMSYQFSQSPGSTEYDMSATAVSQISGLFSDSSSDDDSSNLIQKPRHGSALLGLPVPAPSTPLRQLAQPPAQLTGSLIALDLATSKSSIPSPAVPIPISPTPLTLTLTPHQTPAPTPPSHFADAQIATPTTPSSAPHPQSSLITSRSTFTPPALESIPDDAATMTMPLQTPINNTPRNASKLSHSIRYNHSLSNIHSTTRTSTHSILSTHNDSRHDNRRNALKHLRTVGFVKPSEDILQLRVRTYTPQKEEALPIIHNPQKRPKRKKGFFSAVKGIFSSKKDDEKGNKRDDDVKKDGEGKKGHFSGLTSPTAASVSGSGGFAPIIVRTSSLNSSKGDSRADSKSDSPTSSQPVDARPHSSSSSRRSSTSQPEVYEGEILSEDDSSDSELDNSSPDVVYNTSANGTHRDDVLALFLNWEMEYCGFRDQSMRESAELISFRQNSDNLGIQLGHSPK